MQILINGWGFIPSLISSIFVTGCLSLFVSHPAWRFKKDYFVMLSLDESILMISMIIVGGTGNFIGPIVGAFTLIAIPEILRFLYIPDAIAANIRLLIYGLLIVTMGHLRPQGLAGKYRFK